MISKRRRKNVHQIKFNLAEADIPKAYYNIAAICPYRSRQCSIGYGQAGWA